MAGTDAGAGAPGAPGTADGAATTPASRVALLVGSALLMVPPLLTQPGKVVRDTKIELTLAPATFAERTWHLWDPISDLGRVPNQHAGYLFPFLPFAWVGEALGIPAWVVQRLLIGMLLVAAFWGTARLLDALRIGSPTTRIVGALAFALSPYLISKAGVVPGNMLAGALLPLVLLPLVRGAERGSPRRAACLSALAVALAGGTNAAVVVLVLGAPVLWLLTRQGGPRRRQLTVWWVGATVAATSWWLAPLAIQNRYGIDFLPFTEQPSTIAPYTALPNAVRGNADWLTHLYLREPWIPAGWQLASSAWLVLLSFAVVAAALWGLARRDLPHRLFLVSTLLLGLATVAAGYASAFGNPAAAWVNDLLAGPLAPLRSTFKAEPLVMLALAAGLAHGVALGAEALAARRSEVLRLAVPVAVGVVVVLAAFPLVDGSLLADGGFEEVPSWWDEASDLAAEHPGRILVVPGASQAVFEWGSTRDEPLRWIGAQPFATRTLIPLGSTSDPRVLDAVEAAIARGGDPALVPYLQRMGVSVVLARADLDRTLISVPAPASVDAALVASGLEQVEGFGEVPDQTPSGTLTPESDVALRAYLVPEAATVTTYDAADAVLLSGGPEALMDLARFGYGDQATVLTADAEAAGWWPDQWVTTDTARRRYARFGLARNYEGFTLTADEVPPEGELRTQYLPAPGVEHQAVAELDGATEITASSYGSWYWAIPEVGPWMAFDGDEDTAWVAGPLEGAVGEWLEIDLAAPVDPAGTTIVPVVDGPTRERITSVEVTTDQGSAITDLAQEEVAQELAMPPGTTSTVRITLHATTNDDPNFAGPGIRELAIPGVELGRPVRPPQEAAAAGATGGDDPTLVFSRARTSGLSLTRSDEERRIDRRFDLAQPDRRRVEAWVAPMASPELLDELAPDGPLQVSVSSTLGSLPTFAPWHLLDGSTTTAWVPEQHLLLTPKAVPPTGEPPSPEEQAAAPTVSDADPAVTMTWDERRSVDELELETPEGFPQVGAVEISSAHGTRTADVVDGRAEFEPLFTDAVTVRFRDVTTVSGSALGADRELPLAVASLRLPDLALLTPRAPDPDETFEITCDEGPTVEVDGREVRFAATFTRTEMDELRPVEAEACDETVELDAGTHDLQTSVGAAPVTINVVRLVAPRAAEASDDVTTGPSRALDVARWSADERTVEVGPGDEALLVVSENANDGWSASLDGEALDPVRVDGWRQGYRLPAGDGGTVTLTYGPTRTYQAVLVVGFALLALVLVGALVPSRRPGPAAVGDAVWPLALVVVLAVATAVWITGLAALALLVLVPLGGMRPRWAAAAAPAAAAVAGVATALSADRFPGSDAGAYGWPAQLAVGIAVLAVVGCQIGPDVVRRWFPTATPAEDPPADRAPVPD